MKRQKSPLLVGTLVAALGLTVGGLSMASAADETSAVITNPTKQEALDANATVRNYIESTGVTPTATPTTTTPAPSNTAPADFKATAGDQKIVLTWAKPESGTPTGYIYGRDGVDSTGYGAWSGPTSATSVTLDKLVNGRAYNVFVEAVYASGNKRVSATVTPGVTSTPTPTTPAPTTPVTPTATPTSDPDGERVSGLPFSSGVWNDQNAAQTARFVAGPHGGRPMDNILVYTSRANMAGQNNPSAWRNALPANFDPAKQDLVLAVTTWTGDGAFMNASQAAGIAASMCQIDNTRPIARIDWEMNLQDGAGVNGAVLTASNYSAWVQRFRAVATAMRAAPCDIQIDFNPNYGVDQTTGCNSGTYAWPNNCTRRAFQSLKDVVDIFGIDTYDSWPAVKADGSGWNARLTGANHLEESRKYAIANGKKWSVPEWGVACNVDSRCQWRGNAGGDDPEYIKRMLAYFKQYAGDIAYTTYFNEPNPYIVSDLIDNNPNSRAAFRSFMLAQP